MKSLFGIILLLGISSCLGANLRDLSTLSGRCVEGTELCASQCNCGSGYYACSNQQWIFLPIPQGTVCAQNGSSIVLVFSCPELGPSGVCEGLVTGNCRCNQPIPTTGFPTVNPTTGFPTVNPTTGFPTVNPTTGFPTVDPTLPLSCVEDSTICAHQCHCGSGYYVCSNKRWIFLPIPAGTVCAQKNASAIMLEFSCPEFGSAGTCEGFITGNCNCQRPTLIPTTGFPTINPTTGLPTVNPTTGFPTVIPTTQIPGVCIEGVQRCVNECECGKGFLECVNGKWITRPLAFGTICHQYNATAVDSVFACSEYGSAGLCEGRVHGNCPCSNTRPPIDPTTGLPTIVPTTGFPTINPTTGLPTVVPTTQIPRVCIQGVQRCVKECECERGFFECVNGEWIVRPLAVGTICHQYNETAVDAVFGCSEYGSAGLCEGRVNGNCHCARTQSPINPTTGLPTVIPTTGFPTINPTTGLPTVVPTTQIPRVCFPGCKKCMNECNCGSGYYECVNNNWVQRNLPHSSVCYQKGESIRIYNSMHSWSQRECRNRITGDCHY